MISRNHHRPSQPVIAALQDAPTGLCDQCLVSAVGLGKDGAITPVRRLTGSNRVRRQQNVCDGCHKDRQVNRLVPVITAQPKKAAEEKAVEGVFGINEMDEVRRELIRFLDALEASSSRDGYGKRVGNLRNLGMIEPTIAALMLTHGSYRNEMYYSPFKPSDEEIEILLRIAQRLRSHIKDFKHPLVQPTT